MSSGEAALGAARQYAELWRNDALDALNSGDLPESVGPLAEQAGRILTATEVLVILPNSRAYLSLDETSSHVFLVPTLPEHADLQTELLLNAPDRHLARYPLYGFADHPRPIRAFCHWNSKLPHVVIMTLRPEEETGKSSPLERADTLGDMGVSAALFLADQVSPTDPSGLVRNKSCGNKLAFEIYDKELNGTMTAWLKNMLDENDETEPTLDTESIQRSPHVMTTLSIAFLNTMIGFDPLLDKLPPAELIRLYIERGYVKPARLDEPDS